GVVMWRLQDECAQVHPLRAHRVGCEHHQRWRKHGLGAMVTFGQKQAVKPGPFRLDAFVEQLLTELCRRLSGRLGLVVRPPVGVRHIADLHRCPWIGIWLMARSLRSLYGLWLAHYVRSIPPSPVGQSHPARWA